MEGNKVRLMLTDGSAIELRVHWNDESIEDINRIMGITRDGCEIVGFNCAPSVREMVMNEVTRAVVQLVQDKQVKPNQISSIQFI